MLVEVPAIEQAPAEIARQQPESAQPTAPDLITRQLDGDEVTSPRPEQPEAPASIAEKSASERERLDTTRPASLMLVEVPAIEQAPAEIARQQPESAQPTAPDLITRQLDGDEVTSLVKRGETFIMSGDLASARLLLQRAAEAGDVHAALALAGTFDPNLLGNGLGADAAMARLWYVRAARLGSAEAAQRLQQLATQVNSVP
jgi:TPR repeat protein